MKKFDSIYDFKIKKSDGSEQDMAEFKGKVLLIVNVASKCGFTPQYEDLEKLYELYKAQGFYVLGFPCDQFGHQEPAENKEIQTFCKLNYGVTFP
ncbi:MAG: glutathione peroxidase, partial [Bdellovibrionales bacterium]